MRGANSVTACSFIIPFWVICYGYLFLEHLANHQSSAPSTLNLFKENFHWKKVPPKLTMASPSFSCLLVISDVCACTHLVHPLLYPLIHIIIFSHMLFAYLNCTRVHLNLSKKSPSIKLSLTISVFTNLTLSQDDF